MKNFKKIVTAGFTASMLFAATSCGSVSDTNRNTGGAYGNAGLAGKAPVTMTYSAALSDLSAVTEGKFSMSVKSDGQGDLNIEGRFKNSDFSVDSVTGKVDDEAVTYSDIIAATGDNIYFNIGAMIDSGDSMVVYLPGPDVDAAKVDSVRSSVVKMFSDMLTESAAEFTTADENSVSVEIKTSDDMKKFINGALDYAAAHEDEYKSIMNDATGAVNFSGWLDKIIDANYDDLTAMIGSEMSKDDLKEQIDSSIQFETSELDNFAENVKTAKENFNNMSDEEYDSTIGKDSSIKFAFKKTGDAFVIDFDFNIKPNVKVPEDAADSDYPVSSFVSASDRISGTITVTKTSVDDIAAPENAQNIASLFTLFANMYSSDVSSIAPSAVE